MRMITWKPNSTSPNPLPAEASVHVLKVFADVLMMKENFRQGKVLHEMPELMMCIHLKEGMQPFPIYTPQVILLMARRCKKRTEGNDYARHNLTSRKWDQKLVTVGKPNGGVKITVDLTKFNNQESRPDYQPPTPLAAVWSVHLRIRYLTTLDALYVYWQMPRV